jgi:hypothetical protein
MRRGRRRRPVGPHGSSACAAQVQGLNAALEQGTGLYQAFNGFGPGQVRRVRAWRVIPPVVVELGELVGLIYRSDKWQPGQPRTYIHFMQQRPRLVCDIAGTQLYLLGGRYRVTRRGIEG